MQFEKTGQTVSVKLAPQLPANHTPGAPAAAAGGLSTTPTLSWACSLEFDSGALGRLLPGSQMAQLPLHAYFPMGRAARLPARALVDFLAAGLG